MIKRLIFLPLLLMLAACSGDAIFSENFQEITELPEILQTDTLVAAPDADNNLLHLIVTETGITESGLLIAQLDPTKTDYDVSVHVRIVAGSVRLWARRSDACSGYALILDPNLDTYRLSVMDTATCTLQSIHTQSVLELNTDRWYEMRIKVQGNTIDGYIDGVKYFETESDAFSDGLPMIEVMNNRVGVGQVDVDTLTIK